MWYIARSVIVDISNNKNDKNCLKILIYSPLKKQKRSLCFNLSAQVSGRQCELPHTSLFWVYCTQLICCLHLSRKCNKQNCFLFQVLIYIFCTTCENIEQTGKRITISCYILYKHSGNPYISRELIALCLYVEKLSPHITAAHFFTLNRSLLSTLLSNIVSYLILVVQFSMAKAQ